VYQIPPRAPALDLPKFLRETGLRKIITYPKNLADPESVRKSGFSDLIPRKFFPLEQRTLWPRFATSVAIADPPGPPPTTIKSNCSSAILGTSIFVSFLARTRLRCQPVP
jgi:hypothetical protein